MKSEFFRRQVSNSLVPVLLVVAGHIKILHRNNPQFLDCRHKLQLSLQTSQREHLI